MSETYPAVGSQQSAEPIRILKPGYQTTEFWITIIVQITGMVAVLLPEDSVWAKVTGMLIAVLSAISYNSSRGTLKQRALETVETITNAVRASHKSGLNLLFFLLIPVIFLSGCAVDSLSVQADQARKTAVEPIVLEYAEAHPEQAASWVDFLIAWQRSIDARAGKSVAKDATPLTPADEVPPYLKN